MNELSRRSLLIGLGATAALAATPAFASIDRHAVPEQMVKYRIEAFQIPAGPAIDISTPTAVRDAYYKNLLLNPTTRETGHDLIASGDYRRPATVEVKSSLHQPASFGNFSESPYTKRYAIEQRGDKTSIKYVTDTAFSGWRGKLKTREINGATVQADLDLSFGVLESIAHFPSDRESYPDGAAVSVPIYRTGSKIDASQEIMVRIAEPTVIRFGQNHLLIVTATLA